RSTAQVQTSDTATIPASTVHRTGAVRGPDRTGAASTVARKAPQPRASRNTAVGVRTVRRREGVGTDVYTFCWVVPARDRTAGSSRRRPSTPLYPAAPAAGTPVTWAEPAATAPVALPPGRRTGRGGAPGPQPPGFKGPRPEPAGGPPAPGSRRRAPRWPGTGRAGRPAAAPPPRRPRRTGTGGAPAAPRDTAVPGTSPPGP